MKEDIVYVLCDKDCFKVGVKVGNKNVNTIIHDMRHQSLVDIIIVAKEVG